MIGAFKPDIVLCGCSDEDLLLAQKVYDSYDESVLEPGGFQDGKIHIAETLTELGSSSIGFDLNTPGEIIVKIGGGSDEGKIYYSQGDRGVLLQQLVLMFTGMRILDSDAADIMPILAKGCSFSWCEMDESNLTKAGTELIENALVGSNSDRPTMVLQICGNVSLISCTPLFGEIEKNERIDGCISQIVNYTENGKCIISVFSA